MVTLTRRSVTWRVGLWLTGSVVGAVIVALPDSDDRVFSLSRTHGPSPVDLVGVILLVGCWLPVAIALPTLWRAAGPLAARLSAGLAIVGAIAVAITVGADMGNVWMVAAAMLLVAQVIVIADGWRRLGWSS